MKIPAGEIDKLIPELLWKRTVPGISQSVLGQRQVGELKPSDFRSCETVGVAAVLPAGGQQRDKWNKRTTGSFHQNKGSTALSPTLHKQYFEMDIRFKYKNKLKAS